MGSKRLPGKTHEPQRTPLWHGTSSCHSHASFKRDEKNLVEAGQASYGKRMEALRPLQGQAADCNLGGGRFKLPLAWRAYSDS